MSMEKIRNLNQIKEDVYALYPNAVKVSITFEGDKVTITPTEKYEIDPKSLENDNKG